MGLINVTVVGNVGRDAELTYTQSGKAVCSFTLAVNKRWTTASGEQQESTTWLRCAIWGNRAEALHDHIKKGQQVAVVADTISARPYIDKDGKAAASLELTVKEFSFAQPKQGGGYQYTDNDAPPSYGNSGGSGNGASDIEDIPF